VPDGSEIEFAALHHDRSAGFSPLRIHPVLSTSLRANIHGAGTCIAEKGVVSLIVVEQKETFLLAEKR
jgi:hypothetical protein